ncbi:hypothetical protein ACFL59_09805 [Planctomycetota bacterium]
MSETHERSAIPVATILVLIAILALAYGGAYYLNVRVLYGGSCWDPRPMAPVVGVNPDYRFLGGPSEIVFAPAHWVDRRLRPDLWAPRPAGMILDPRFPSRLRSASFREPLTEPPISAVTPETALHHRQAGHGATAIAVGSSACTLAGLP